MVAREREVRIAWTSPASPRDTLDEDGNRPPRFVCRPERPALRDPDH